jgi:hypothetical protein
MNPQNSSPLSLEHPKKHKKKTLSSSIQKLTLHEDAPHTNSPIPINHHQFKGTLSPNYFILSKLQDFEIPSESTQDSKLQDFEISSESTQESKNPNTNIINSQHGKSS